MNCRSTTSKRRWSNWGFTTAGEPAAQVQKALEEGEKDRDQERPGKPQPLVRSVVALVGPVEQFGQRQRDVIVGDVEKRKRQDSPLLERLEQTPLRPAKNSRAIGGFRPFVPQATRAPFGDSGMGFPGQRRKEVRGGIRTPCKRAVN